MAQAEDVVQSVVDLLKAIPEFQELAFQVYSEKDLMDKIKMINSPAAGVIYEGMRSVGDQGKDSHKTGLSAEMGVSVVIFLKPEMANDTSVKAEGLTILDKVRIAMRDSRSPTGHFWRFVLEAPALEKDGLILWVQRWSSPVKLTQNMG